MNECKGMNFTMTFDQVVRIDNDKGVIEQLQNDVKELQEEVGQLNTEVSENSNKLSGIEDGAERNGHRIHRRCRQVPCIFFQGTNGTG